MKVRTGGHIVNVACLLAVGVNNEGRREITGVDVATTEDGVGWLAFFRSLVARGLSGTQLVISDDHPGLVNAIEIALHASAALDATNDEAATSGRMCQGMPRRVFLSSRRAPGGPVW